MTAVVLVGTGLVALAGIFLAESRAARERDLIGRMESVLCAGSSCDIEMGMREG